MHLILAIRKLRPAGGKERDCMGLAQAFLARGHAVTVLTGEAPPAQLEARAFVLAPAGASNHARQRAFAEAVQRWQREQGDDLAPLIAFEAIPSAQFLFVAGRPFAEGAGWKAILPRYRAFQTLEAATFGDGGRGFAFFLAEAQAGSYHRRYGIGPDRFLVLPPTYGAGRAAPATFYAERQQVRAEFGIPPGAPLLIHVAFNGALKGLDRVIGVVAALPDAHLIVVGETGVRFRGQAARRGVTDRVRFVGPRDDLPRIIGAADVLVHPARVENTGTVILESLLYGVPAVVTDVCGYASHVARSGAGAVIASPYRQADLLAQVRAVLAPQHAERFRRAARDYSAVLSAEGGLDAVADAMLRSITARWPDQVER